MDFQKTKIEIFWSGDNIGFTLKEGDDNIDWNTLTRNEQLTIINGFSQGYGLFSRFLKEE
ncbi:MAG: hypothetical protein KBS70_08290 [Bacteroidales bacterium]|nr:hypothetical protein [Candidatus Colicola equi]